MFLQSVLTDVTNDPSNAIHSGRQAGQGAGHSHIDLAYVLWVTDILHT